MLSPDTIKPKTTSPAKPISLSTQIASGLAAMAMTMTAMVITLPPDDVADAGRILVASSSLFGRSAAQA